jgi:hypothetical protein
MRPDRGFAAQPFLVGKNHTAVGMVSESAQLPEDVSL